MHDDAPIPQIPRYIPFKRGGWGVALFICALAVASALSAYYVHRRTFLAPTDVRNHSVGSSSSHE
jgi:hypothetical protein